MRLSVVYVVLQRILQLAFLLFRSAEKDRIFAPFTVRPTLGQYGVEANEPFVGIEVMSAEHYAKA